ncbi:MAG: hypothetical protein WDO19_24230 [Bacteroidota bacterium]
MGRSINKLVQGEPILDIGDADIALVEKNPLKPLLGDTWIEGQIIFIDNFGKRDCQYYP